MNTLHRCFPFMLLMVLLLSNLHTAQAIADTAEKRAQELRSHLNSLSSLSFHFTQRTSGQMSGRPRQASGQAYFVKTDNEAKMRWNYLAPDKQVIISDGETLSMYFEKLNQMIITPADALQQDITYIFFTGEGEITDDFFISNGIDEQDLTAASSIGHDVIRLQPKAPNSQIKEIRLWVTSSNTIKRIEIKDSFDTITLLNISNTEENMFTASTNAVPPDLFNFSPPKGTEIIHQ